MDELRSREKALDAAVKAMGVEATLKEIGWDEVAEGRDPLEVRFSRPAGRSAVHRSCFVYLFTSV